MPGMHYGESRRGATLHGATGLDLNFFPVPLMPGMRYG